MDEPDAAEAILSLAAAAPGRESFDATLQQIVDLARVGVTRCSMAGITLLEATGPTTAAATSQVATAVDAIQYRVNGGPCLDAYRRQIVNRIDSTASDERAGAVFAAHASVTLAHIRAFWQTDELRRHLEEALSSRGVIDQAKGVLTAREGFDADDAFEVLRHASQRANRRVHDLAQEIVDGTRRDTGQVTA